MRRTCTCQPDGTAPGSAVAMAKPPFDPSSRNFPLFMAHMSRGRRAGAGSSFFGAIVSLAVAIAVEILLLAIIFL